MQQMAEAKTEQEPSIEKIFEPTRQIISEDGDAGVNPVATGQSLDLAQAAASAPPSPVPLSLSPDRVSAPSSSSLSRKHSFEQKPESAPPSDMDILDLTDKVNPAAVSAVELIDRPALMDKPKTMDEPMTTDKPSADNTSGLMSAQTADAATEALAKLLAGNLAIEKDDTGRNGKITLEEMAGDLMKPVLKIWLDQNLPGIIEKIVQREVERLSRRAMDR